MFGLYEKVNSGHCRKYLVFACCSNAQTDSSPTSAFVFASFPPKEMEAQAAFSFTSRLILLSLERNSSRKLSPDHSSSVTDMRGTGNLNPVPSSNSY